MDGRGDLAGGTRAPRHTGARQPSPRVHVVGTLACDLVEYVDRLPGPDGFCLVERVARHPGGSAANVAVQLSRLGAQVGFSGAVGDDEEGLSFARSLDEEGVGRRGLLARPGRRTTVSRVTVARDASRFISLDMGDAFDTLQPRELNRADIAGAGVLYTDLLPRAAAEQAVSYARDAGTPVVAAVEVPLPLMGRLGWEGERGMEALGDALGRADVVLPCAAALRGLSPDAGDDPRDQAAALLARLRRRAGAGHGGPSLVVATLGARGCVAAQADGPTLLLPAAPTPGPVVDTTGAGDAFAAGLVFGLALRDRGTREALGLALDCAARVVCVRGAHGPCDVLRGLGS